MFLCCIALLYVPCASMSKLSSYTVRYCPWLEELDIQCGPQLSSSDVTDMTAGRGLACLRSLSLSFTPISPKALHQLTSECGLPCNVRVILPRPAAACPRLSSLTLHISPNTYFPGTAADSKTLNKYHQIHLNFQVSLLPPPLLRFHYPNINRSSSGCHS